MYKYPKVSIIILNWNGLKDTIECLESLKKITYPNYEVIVVDNGSKINEGEILKEKFGNYICVIRNKKNLGFAEGNNVAIKKVLKENKSKYIMFLNNDTIVDKNFLSELVFKAEKDPRFGIVGPEIHYYDLPQNIHSRGGTISLFWGWHFVGGTFHKYPYKNDEKFVLQYFSGCAFLIRCNILKKIGEFDRDYFYYTEDVDLGYRVYKAGYKIVCNPKSKIYHKEGRSVGGNIRNPLTAFYETRNAILFIRKHGRIHHLIIFIPILILKITFEFIKFFRFERRLIKYRLKGFLWHLKNKVE